VLKTSNIPRCKCDECIINVVLIEYLKFWIFGACKRKRRVSPLATIRAIISGWKEVCGWCAARPFQRISPNIAIRSIPLSSWSSSRYPKEEKAQGKSNPSPLWSPLHPLYSWTIWHDRKRNLAGDLMAARASPSRHVLLST
jgi:hypothetical protein